MGERDITAIRQWLLENAKKLKRQADELNRLRKQIAVWTKTFQSRSKNDETKARR